MFVSESVDIPCLGMMALSPNAPALPQSAASSLIFVRRSFTDRRRQLKTQLLWCFPIIQGMRRVKEARPFAHGLGGEMSRRLPPVV